MGAGASLALSSGKRFEEWTPEDVAKVVCDVGEAFSGYGQLLVDNGIDGAVISSFETDDELKTSLEEIGITKNIHIRTLITKLNQVKQKIVATATEEEATANTAEKLTFNGLTCCVENNNFVEVSEIDEISNFDDGCSFQFCANVVKRSQHDDGLSPQEKITVQRRPQNPFEAHYPLYYVPGYIVLQLESLPTHEQLIESKAILKTTGHKHFYHEGFAPDQYGGCVTEFVHTHLLLLESGNYLSTSHRRIFFSHRWVQGSDGSSTPDNANNVKLNEIKALVKPSDLVWVDYMCIPQAADRRAEQLLAIQSLPHYIGFSDKVQIVYSDEENKRQYKTRAFTNIELVCASTPIVYSGCIEMSNTFMMSLAPVYESGCDDNKKQIFPFLNPVHADMYDKRDLPEIVKLIEVIKDHCRVCKYDGMGMKLLKFLEAPPPEEPC
jgi:hypothetical protein